MEKNDGGPAFPVKWQEWHDQQVACMTPRDHFAGMAMLGLTVRLSESTPSATIAEWAYQQADAMLAARERK